jgi:hypothetical protein
MNHSFSIGHLTISLIPYIISQKTNRITPNNYPINRLPCQLETGTTDHSLPVPAALNRDYYSGA